MTETTFILIKPDMSENDQFFSELLNRIKAEHLEVKPFTKIEKINKSILKKHYQHLVNETFYPSIEKYMTSGPVKFTTVSGENAILKIRKILGSTNPKNADKQSLRHKYGKVENDCIKNCCHASDSVDSAKREIDLWLGDHDEN